MDVFAHVLWTNIAYYKKYTADRTMRAWAVFFGVMPDVISFLPLWFYLLYLYLNGRHFAIVVMADPFQAWPVEWGRLSYQYTHSLVVFAAVFVISMAIRRGKVYWPLLGWALHIGIDIFTHPDFYQTPFLFPISSIKNHYAISWADPWFMAVNYTAMAVVYFFVFYVRKRKKA